MSSGRVPRAYIDDTPTIRGGSQGPMEYVDSFPNLGIGARPSGLPKGNPNGINSLEHVGGVAGRGK